MKEREPYIYHKNTKEREPLTLFSWNRVGEADRKRLVEIKQQLITIINNGLMDSNLVIKITIHV